MSPLAHHGYSYAPFIAKSKAACGLCFYQPGGHVELPWLMRMYDVVHKTGYITYRDAARGGPSHGYRLHAKKIGKDRTCISGDMLANR